ncbi:DNA ligase 1-like [Diorhabda carinulata]|uniref:DNA ligase 1-like n=1 Tax=Diorhabda sublineata TaxID=1163346 RepID=UPI0024E07845|nr:DNA ligase 1-like [Diorhabda sublineata]XP_057668129.1 DNA ligase 1-like [Diorhabda carinulata]
MPETHKEIILRENFRSPEKIVIRKILNPAIYVEKPIIPPLRKTSPLLVNSVESDEEITISSRSNGTLILTDRSVKRCTCISNHGICQCHSQEIIDKKSESWDSDSDSSSSSAESQITVKSKNYLSDIDDEMRLSLGSINTERTVTLDAKEKEEKVKKWLKQKEQELKQKKLEEEKKKQEEERERQIKLAQKKESYMKWREAKKLQLEKQKKEKELQEAEKIRLAEEKQKKQDENEKKFQMWLKQKKQQEKEKKMFQKMTELKIYQEKQKRMEKNEKAFHEWLKISKYRPKPLNNTLCTSPSVTFINPDPWVANIDGETPITSK